MDSGCGVVYTKPWVVRMMLRLGGYVPDRDLAPLRILEPSCGEGAFLREIIDSLCKSAEKFERGPSDLRQSISAHDIDPKKVEASRIEAISSLKKHGIKKDVAEELASVWVNQSDFLLTNLNEKYDFVVGNPPLRSLVRHLSRTAQRICQLPRDCFHGHRSFRRLHRERVEGIGPRRQTVLHLCR